MDNSFYKPTASPLRPPARRSRFALTPVALVAAALWPVVHAQDAAGDARLKASPMLRETIPQQQRGQLPTFVRGDNVQGRTDLETVIEGGAELRRGDTMIRADRIEYYQPDDLAKARGKVHINKAGNQFDGPVLELKIDSFEGYATEPSYRFLRNDAYGTAERIDFIDDKHAVIRNATYTTCQRKPGPSWMPDWILRAQSLRIDEETGIGQASGAVLSFKGVPIIPVPEMSFPLSDERKSGFLPPTIGIDSVSGLETTVPYYWNIAPNRDATLYPTLMTKRGLDLGAEFRYLERDYKGVLRGNYLPADKLRDRDRWGLAARHDGIFHLPGVGALGLNLNINRVSDDNYWRDFSHTSASLTQRLLAGEGAVSWSRGDFSFVARELKWQVLQDPASIIVPPYDRAPQLIGRWNRSNFGAGFDSFVEADYSRFEADRLLTGQPNARRGYVWAGISRPWQAPGWIVTPKLMVHSRQYSFDAPLASTNQSTANVTVPTFSLDSGLVFERDTSYFGRAFRQTLEPRAFYVYTPFRNQNYLPVYDAAQLDFNFATIYTENAFGGHDRIADNNLLTLGVSTRLLDPDTGAEAARFVVAQRLRFEDQRVVLPGGTPASERLSDLLFGMSLALVPKWSVDATVQYNPKTERSERSTIGARYNPSNYHVISAAYRLQRGLSEQLDVGWQWPLNDLWGDRGTDQGPGRGLGEGRIYTVGRLNYSLRDRRLVDSVIGFEYDGGCWVGRVVVERLQNSLGSSNKRILFQMEFVGFTHLGSNALLALKQNIPRYQFLREQVRQPSRFGSYD